MLKVRTRGCGRFGHYNPNDITCKGYCIVNRACKVKTERACEKCQTEMELRAGVVLVCPRCGNSKTAT